MSLDPLPIDAHIDEVRARLACHRAVVVTAAPGAGKTTRVPPAVLARGPVILLQPRRVAARAVARRIAAEQGWTLGREVGWQIRFERRFSHDTRLLVVTEGILTARLQQDPLLSEFATVVFDEFHERSIHADLGLALARQAWLAREDLHIIVMSATLDVARVSTFLSGCPVVEVPGTLHPMIIEYAAEESVAAAVAHVVPRTPGNVLCFLAGRREIERAHNDVTAFARANGIDVVPLHGGLESDDQERALSEGATRKVILATNIAETSLTVPGVTAVVDTGLHKVARYDGGRAIDSLSLERVTQDSADQRAGRAARLGPGLVRRLWDGRQRLQPHREPEIARVDLAGPVLDLLAWGADPERFEWFAAPPAERLADALRLLTRLGAIDPPRTPERSKGRALTPLGAQMQRIPAHPRIARILLDGKAAPDVVALCARLSGDAGAADHLWRLATHAMHEPPSSVADDARLRHAVFAGYADRLGKRRPDGPDRVALASGHGAILLRECGDLPGDFLVALDVVAGGGAEPLARLPRWGPRAAVAEARIRAASAVDPEWIVPTSSTIEHRFDRARGRVRAARIDRYDALLLREHPIAPDAEVAARLTADAWLQRGPDPDSAQLLRRLLFAGRELDLPTLVAGAAMGASSIDAIDIGAHLPFEVRRALAADAPEVIPLPSGRTARVDYGEDGTVSASVKLQELFGLAETPRLGPRRIAVTLHLLAPNGRPVQTTADLRSFWERTYPEVRKELRGRYPKHPWPEDPWTATPTHRTTRKTPG